MISSPCGSPLKSQSCPWAQATFTKGGAVVSFLTNMTDIFSSRPNLAPWPVEDNYVFTQLPRSGHALPVCTQGLTFEPNLHLC